MDLIRFTTDLNAGFTKVPTEGNDYLVEHSGNITLINPRGDYHGFFRPPFDAQRLHLAFSSVKAQYERDYGK
jgi:protein SCO1/2